MWNNFQKVLEKRVQGGRVLRKDKYFIRQVFNQVILDSFGKIGVENIIFCEIKQEKLFLKCEKSVWRSELRLKEVYLLKQIALKMREKKPFQKIIFKNR